MLAEALQSGSTRKIRFAAIRLEYFEFTEDSVEYFGYVDRQRDTGWTVWTFARKADVATESAWREKWLDMSGRAKNGAPDEPLCYWTTLNDVQMAGRMRRKAVNNIKAGKEVDWPKLETPESNDA